MQKFLVLFCFFLLKFNSSYGCSMENISNWLLPVTTNISDIERDVFFRRSTSNIEGINSVSNSEGLNGGPYLTVSYSNSEFTIAPNAQFVNYEENETEQSIAVTVNFRCTGGSSNTLVFIINIIDTNNNAPQFRPSDNYHYKVAPPLPPGFLITDCVNNIIVRDIDLTTQRIDFEIEENPFFEIISDTSTKPKEFKAILRTTTFIRRMSEPIILRIRATDVDLTGDPAITSNATVRIEADTEFEFPDDLIFSQTFYIAVYTTDGNILLDSDIYLQQGFDAGVNFSLGGDNKDLFDIDVNENRITLRAISQLPTDLLTNQIYLILKASREHTSGATATVIVNLPEGPIFKFEETYYKGSIVDNALRIPNLVLQENSHYPEIQINVYSALSQYFTADVLNNNVILRMDPLNDVIIRNNNILTLQVVAVANNRTAATVVVLEIVKDDFITPIFEKNIYNATYDPNFGVTVENITIIQGFDETVTVSLEGAFESYFQITQDGNIFNIITSGLPSNVTNEQRLLLTIIATKPRTVGAQAVLYIAMPEARALAFKSLTYSGFLVNNSVILETIVLNTGYDEDVSFGLSGDYASYFVQSNSENIVTLSVSDQILESIISDNNIIILILTAEGNNTDIATTTVVLEIIKQDTSTPIFSKNIYHGYYLDASTISIENIFLTQGFDDNVTFRLSGDNAQYFSISYTGNNNITISLDTIIPEDLIFNEKVLLFTIIAEKPFSVGANAAISINFPRELTEPSVMRFSKNSYIGNITNEIFTMETIILDQGFPPQTEFSLSGDHASLFNVANDGIIVTIQLNEQLPEDIIENNNFIILDIEAIHPRTINAHATIVVNIIRQLEPNIITPVFERPYYYGEYSLEDKLQFNQTIQFIESSQENISFGLEGDNSVWFSLTPLNDGVTLTLQNPIPSEVLAHNQQLIFIVTANVFNTTITARTTIIIGLRNGIDELVVLKFSKPNFIGTINNNTLNIETISLVQGFSHDVVFTLQGELATYFSIIVNESTVTFHIEDIIPDNAVPNNRIILLQLVATAPQAIPADVTIVIEVVTQDIPSNDDLLKFSEPYYIGSYKEIDGLDFNHNITLAEGNDETVQFTLVGENSLWFGVVPTNNGVTISLTRSIPTDVLNNNQQLVFEISASKPSSSVIARSAIIITIAAEGDRTPILGFEKSVYLGTVDNKTVNLEPIILVDGFTSEVQFSIRGELASLFTKRTDGETVHILLEDTMPEEILSENRVIILELEAIAPETLPSYTTVVLEVIQQNHLLVQVLKFKEPYYTGQYKENDVLEFEQVIALTDGSRDGVEYSLEGDNSIWFSLEEVEDGFIVILSTPIPQNIQSENMFLTFIITATKPDSITARSTIVISLPNASDDTNIYFDKLLYRGVIRDNILSHENILVSGYNGTDVEIFGEHVNLLVVQIDQGLVSVDLRDTSVAVNNSYVILEIRVLDAGCVLQLDVIGQEIPALPTVRFSSESYIIQVDISQTGLIGQVSATANNGESITYSLSSDNDTLKESLSINSNGELHLSTSMSSGVYTFLVVATSDVTQVNGTATVILVVESGEGIVLPPLIIIEKDEESPYNNLVTLNTSQDCRYEMTNRWPIDQTWLYVDDNGLHTNAIDREHNSIAFMALSQIQVELNLQCDTDKMTVSKRSINNIPTTKSLGPYDYGTYRWVLTEPILYNPRRSYVNLIVNDINDNDPIFELKANEPIAVGYPLPELEEVVAPRALVELTATDADIGENAALVYWSSEPTLAVSPTTGRVHVNNSSLLQNGARLRVSATDRNGVDGRTGYIDLVVRLLDVQQIAVVTIQGAFLEDENSILSNLTNALGYEVKALRSVIMPMDANTNENTSRKERTVVSTGALLHLFIYGLINHEPVAVSRLTTDINNIVMSNIARTVSLEDHLESREICSLPARDTGLLVATIALSILLFILVVVFAVWLFLKWRKTYNYNNFSDQNSLASRDQIPPTVKIEEPKPRMNIEELKRSERRLQDILDTPETSTQNDNQPETVVDVPTPEQRMPIVIQSIDKLKDAAEMLDDEDEFGETQKARRKSVVTFNENVEKIIHLEDTPSDADYEVYKF